EFDQIAARGPDRDPHEVRYDARAWPDGRRLVLAFRDVPARGGRRGPVLLWSGALRLVSWTGVPGRAGGRLLVGLRLCLARSLRLRSVGGRRGRGGGCRRTPDGGRAVERARQRQRDPGRDA